VAAAPDLARKAAAEATGSALLLAVVAASDTFAGIRPADAPGFIVAQLLGAGAATFLFRWLVPSLPAVAEQVVDFPAKTAVTESAQKEAS
jgi:glycerol uptake facilitator-like aquaporin